MGLFRKKRDPISERKRELDAKIAALEAEIKRLSEEQSSPPEANKEAKAAPQPTPAPPAPAPPPPPPAPPRKAHGKAPPKPAPQPSAAPTSPNTPRPRLRSTALPHGPTITSPPSPAEPVFEELDQQRLHEHPEGKPPAPERDLAQDLGVRKNGFLAFWDRLWAPFRGPATTNPKLVNYLAAGSIQGLRPLRYEKRVARNRLFLLVGLLILLLWGIIAVLIKHKG